jgi:hypothetical protein
MTRVASIILLENCLDSSWVKQFTLNSPIDEHLMHFLAENGSLKYYPHFPRPYFRIEHPGKYVIQGVMNNDSLRVTFSPRATEQTELALTDRINASDTK